MQYKHIQTPIFRFGMPDVKWIEIDDSIIQPYEKPDEYKRTLVFIDTEWGPVNRPIPIDSKKEFVETFGYIPDLINSQKGLDYLSQYLQSELQGRVPLVVVRVQTPHLKNPQQPQEGYYEEDHYKQKCQYEFKPTIFFTHLLDISKSVTVKNNQETITYTQNTDYTLVSNGITILNLKEMKAGDILKITYTRIDKNIEVTQTYKIPYQYELLVIESKQAGLFGQDFGFRLYYDSVYTTWNQEIGMVDEIVQQDKQLNGQMKNFESFVADTLTELFESITTYSEYISIKYYVQNPDTYVIEPEQQMGSDPIIVKTIDDSITFVEDVDYYVDLVENEIHLIISNDSLTPIYENLKITYIPDGETDPVTEQIAIPVIPMITKDTESISSLFRIGQIARQTQELFMQCPICQGQDDLLNRYQFYNNYKYFDSVQQSITYSALTQNAWFNPPRSMATDFQTVLDYLISEYKIDNPEEFELSYIATLGLNKHSYFME